MPFSFCPASAIDVVSLRIIAPQPVNAFCIKRVAASQLSQHLLVLRPLKVCRLLIHIKYTGYPRPPHGVSNPGGLRFVLWFETLIYPQILFSISSFLLIRFQCVIKLRRGTVKMPCHAIFIYFCFLFHFPERPLSFFRFVKRLDFRK